MNNPDERDGRGILGRWARRKSAARRGERIADEPAPVETIGANPVPSVEPLDTGDAPLIAPPPAPAEQPTPPLPDVESLTGDSDFSPFMSRDVDAALRRTALRKLFHTPAMNIRDGLDDYDDDYTSFVPLGDTITSDMRNQVKVAAERAAREQARIADVPAGEQPALTPGDDTAAAEVEQAATAPQAVEAPGEADPVVSDEVQAEPEPAPRQHLARSARASNAAAAPMTGVDQARDGGDAGEDEQAGDNPEDDGETRRG